MDDYKDMCKMVVDKLANKYTSSVTDLLFKNFSLVSMNDKVAVFTSPSNAFLPILKTKYTPEIEEILEEILHIEIKVKIFKEQDFDLERYLSSPDTYTEKEKEEAAKPAEKEEDKENNEEIDDYYSDNISERKFTSADNSYTFENFVVGESNKFAYKASFAVAENPTSYNPLFIYGQSGLGKTHLMKAIAAYVIQKNPSYNVILVKGESFTNELIEAIAQKNTAGFKEKYRKADMLLIDDIQFIAGKVATQEEFFHTFNALYESNKQIVLTSDRPPKDIKQLDDRIRSRFESGLDVDIQPPDTELRMAILQRKAKLINVDLSNDVLTFIAENIKNNVRQIEGVIKKLGAYKFVTDEEITVEVAKEQLAGFLSGKESPEVTVEKIISEIAKKYSTTPEEIKGKKRSKDVAMARHVAIYTIRNATDMSLKNIGKIFDRDHTTMMSSLDVVGQAMEQDAGFEHEINSLIKEFKI